MAWGGGAPGASCGGGRARPGPGSSARAPACAAAAGGNRAIFRAARPGARLRRDCRRSVDCAARRQRRAPGSAAAVGAARRRAAPELEAELVDLVLHGAGGGEGLEVLGGAAHELGLELVDLRSKGGRAHENIVPKEAGQGRVQESWRTHLAALAALQRELYGGSLLAEDEIPEHGQRFANDLTGACVR